MSRTERTILIQKENWGGLPYEVYLNMLWNKFVLISVLGGISIVVLSLCRKQITLRWNGSYYLVSPKLES